MTLYDGWKDQYEHAFDALLFALGADSEEERAYVSEVIEKTAGRRFDPDQVRIETPEIWRQNWSVEYSTALAEALEQEPADNRKEFYERPINDRVEYMIEATYPESFPIKTELDQVKDAVL